MTSRNPKTQLRKIVALAKTLNITVRFTTSVSKAGEATWYPESRVIHVHKYLDTQLKVWSIVHELGHAIYDGLLQNQARYKSVDRAYHRMHSGKKLSKRQHRLIWNTEVVAWEMGEAVMLMLNIPRTREYRKQRRAALKTYL